MNKNKIRLTESKLNHIIKESVSKVLNETNYLGTDIEIPHEKHDVIGTMQTAIENLERTIDVFEYAQALSYNFGMAEEANKVFRVIWDFKTKIEQLLAEKEQQV